MDFSESDNFNAELIAEEADRLASVIGMINEEIYLLEHDGFSYRTVDIYDEQDVEDYRTEKFRHDERKLVIRMLKNSLSTPYFARMRLIPSGERAFDDSPSMTRMRSLTDARAFDGETDIYVGANVIIYRDRIIVYSHNSPLGNRIYDRFENGVIEYGGYVYKVVFRRKFDIRGGKLMAVFQDYSSETGGVVYDKFLAHMLKVRRGDKRLTDIIPTIQANQNAIITRPVEENAIVTGCAGCGKTMIILQRLEYLGFNKKLDLEDAIIIAPGKRYIEHIAPVVDDLMINAARRLTMGELYRDLIVGMRGVRASERRALAACMPTGDDDYSDQTLAAIYGDDIKRKLIAALAPVKHSYTARLAVYREKMRKYEDEVSRARFYGYQVESAKPTAPAVAIDLKKFPFLPPLDGFPKCKLYLLLTAYCYVLGKTDLAATLFVDEAQDIFFNEYKLLSECTKVHINVYGDENQQISPSRGIGSFDRLLSLWDMKRFSLNENYRNAREITEYVNGLLGMNVTSLGLEGGSVSHIGLDTLCEEIKRSGDDRVAVIYAASDKKTGDILKRTVPQDILFTVKQCKGMEYERVYACGEMSDREKCVAYTRALEKLYICK